MSIKEIKAKSLLRTYKKIDSWFISHYGMNLYRGCLHNCVYCDGRSEKYYVDGEFGKDVSVKVNAIDILKDELNKKRKLASFKKSYMIGDRISDIIAGYLVGCKTVLCMTGKHKEKIIETDLEINDKIKPNYKINNISELKKIVI